MCVLHVNESPEKRWACCVLAGGACVGFPFDFSLFKMVAKHKHSLPMWSESLSTQRIRNNVTFTH